MPIDAAFTKKKVPEAGNGFRDEFLRGTTLITAPSRTRSLSDSNKSMAL